MFYTYVLLCVNTKRKSHQFYIGSTSNLDKRRIIHITKSVKSTKRFDKIELVYYEACLNKSDARKRELQLKTGFGRVLLRGELKVI